MREFVQRVIARVWQNTPRRPSPRSERRVQLGLETLEAREAPSAMFLNYGYAPALTTAQTSALYRSPASYTIYSPALTYATYGPNLSGTSFALSIPNHGLFNGGDGTSATLHITSESADHTSFTGVLYGVDAYGGYFSFNIPHGSLAWNGSSYNVQFSPNGFGGQFFRGTIGPGSGSSLQINLVQYTSSGAGIQPVTGHQIN